MEKELSFLADVLEFASFWMVAPEILGETRMRQISRQVMRLEKFMPGMVFGLSGVLVGISFALAGKKLKSQPEWNTFVMGFMLVYMALILVFQKKIANWLALKIFMPFFQELSDSELFRKRFLGTGVSLFILAFLLKVFPYFFG